MAITALPSAPSRTEPSTFSDKGDALLGALAGFVTEANALETNVNAKETTASAAATTATTQAGTATTQAGIATTKATEASTSANAAASSAALAAGYVGTSTTSLLISIASKTFTTQASEQWQAGQWITATSAANNANWMYGQITSYSNTTLIVDIQVIGGSGTYADWNLSLSGARGATGTGITTQAVGWTATGGTTPKTLTVTGDATISATPAVLGANTFTGVQTFGASVNETKTAPSIAEGVLPINCALGSLFAVSLNANITSFTVSNIPASGTFYGFLLEFTADGTPRSVTWTFQEVAVKWSGATAPTLTSTNGKKDTFVFYTWNAGTTWIGAVVGQNL